jgi:hypothetical protein
MFETLDGVEWRFIDFYGEPAWEDKHISWDCLCNLKIRATLPWIVIGAFNEIMYLDDTGEIEGRHT